MPVLGIKAGEIGLATIKGITVQIGADTTGLDAALKDVNKTSREISKELREVERLLKFNPHDTELLAQKQKLLADQVENTREKLNRLREVQAQVNQQFQEGKISEEQYRAFQRELIKTESQLKNYEKQLKAVNLQNHEFNQKMQEAGKKLQDVGKQLTDVGKTLSTRLTAPLAALGAVSAKSAVDFESAFASVRKTVDATEEEFAALERGIRDMAKEIPAAATEIAGVAEAAGQLGIQNEHILSFTRTMIDLGESTNMSAEQAATALARLANITQMPQSEFDKLGSTIVALGNNLATTEAEIVEMGLRLAGAGKQVGMTEAEILSLAGALSSVGIEAQAGGSAFSKVMVQMQLAAETGSEKLEQFAAVAGMSADQFARQFRENAAEALIAFITGLQRTEEQGISAIKVLDDMGITEVRMRDALLRAAGAGNLFTESIKLGTQAWEENTALTNEAAQRYETTASKLEIMRNRLQDVAITFGEVLLPPLVAVAEKVGEFADWLAGLDPKLKTIIVTVGGLAAALGPVLIVLGQIVSSIGTLMPLLGTLAAFIKTTLIPAIAGISLPAVATVGAIAALAAVAYEVYRAWDEVKAALSATWEYLKASAERLALNMSLSFERMKHVIINAVGEILERLSVLENLPFGLGDGFVGLKDKIGESVDGSKQKIAELEAALETNAARMTEAVDGMKVSWGDVGAKVAEDVQAVIRAITGQTEAYADELGEQTDIIIEETEAQTAQVQRAQQAQTAIVAEQAEERTGIIIEEAEKQSEERQEIYDAEAKAIEAAIKDHNNRIRQLAQQIVDERNRLEQSWQERLFEHKATELEKLEAAKQKELELAKKYGADTAAIEEYYALRRQEILEEEAKIIEERLRSNNERIRELAKKLVEERESIEKQWQDKLFNLTASELEKLERAKEEAIRLARAKGADTTAIEEYYSVLRQQIIDEEINAVNAKLEAQREAIRAKVQEIVDERQRLEYEAEVLLFQLTASELDKLQREYEERLALYKKYGADVTALTEYYAKRREEIIKAQEEAERQRLDRINQRIEDQNQKIRELAQKLMDERTRIEQSWQDKLFDLKATELEKLEKAEREALELARKYGADTTAIAEYFALKRHEIESKWAEETTKVIKDQNQRIREQVTTVVAERTRLEEEAARKLFEVTATELEKLEREFEAAKALYEKYGADITALEQYYSIKRQEIRDREREEADRARREQNERIRGLAGQIVKDREELEEEWRRQYLSLINDREALLQLDYEKAIERAKQVGADLADVEAVFSLRMAQLAEEIADEQKSAWEKALDAIQSPIDRLVSAVTSAADSIMSVGKAIKSGNWQDVFLTVLMETEAFAKAMELIGAVLHPVVTLFDLVLKPIINGILSLWNGIIDALSRIEIFGWKPFGNLANKKIDPVGKDKDEPKGGGRQVSEITGPTRDILTDLLSPLAHLGQIVAPIQDIRQILYERLPNFNTLDFAGAGVGVMGPTVIIENLNVTAPTTGVDDISRATIDKIEKALAGRIAIGQRGRGGR